MDWTGFFWLALMVLFLFMEASTVVLVSTWFAFGALAALITSLFGAQFWVQSVVFVVVSAVLLAALRPVFQKYLKPKQHRTNIDAIIGTTGVVTAQIDNLNACGQVKLAAMEWSARSTTQENIPVGTVVKVDKIEGVKAYVTPVQASVTVK